MAVKMLPLLLLLFPDTATALARDVELATPHSGQLLAMVGAAAAVALYYGGLGMADQSRKRRKTAQNQKQSSLHDMFGAGTWEMSVTTEDDVQAGAGTCV